MTTVAYKITEPMKEKVLSTLDGMAEIARAEMMARVGYVTPAVARPRRRGAVCQGHKACAIGSLWLAAGVKLQPLYRGTGNLVLPGVSQGERGEFIRTRPVLRHSLHFLNQAASEYMDLHDILPSRDLTRDAIESLFESDDCALYGSERRRAMLKVIAAAKRKVRAA